MDAIQKSLENKKNGLIKATYWTGVFGRLYYFTAAIYLSFVLIGYVEPEMYSILVSNFLPAESITPAINEMYFEIFFQAALGWWLLRVRDAFQAITEMIDELAETV